MNYLLCSAAAVGLLAFSPLSAAAQSTGQNTTESSEDAGEAKTLDNITVTARKREESVRDVPSTITALSSEQLEKSGPVEGVGDMLRTVPGVRFNSLQSENLAEVSIRGSGTARATSADSGVGLFVNGAYVGSSTLGGRNFKRIDYFDMARVEVLEGPQGALYGRNSEFGVTNIVLAKPLYRNGGRVTADHIFELGQTKVEGILNQKVNDQIAFRVGVQAIGQTDGFYYNPNSDKYYDNTSGMIARGQVRYRNDKLDVNLLVDTQDMDLPSFANQFVLPPGRLGVLPQGYTSDRYEIAHEGKDGLHQKIDRAMLTATYDLGWADLSSTSMALKSESEQYFAAAVDLATQVGFAQQGWIGLYPFGQTHTFAQNETFYQDFRLDGTAFDESLNWLIGLEALSQDDFYQRDAASSPCPTPANASLCAGTPTTPICVAQTPTSPPCPDPFPRSFGTTRLVPSEYRSGAIYGSLEYITGPFSLNGELRYSKDKKTASQTNYLLYTTTLQDTPTSFTFDEGNVSYTVTGSYTLPGTLKRLVYAKVGTGYRAGGVNNGIPNAAAPNPLQTTYGNETTISYEAGIKASITDAIYGRLSAYESRTSDAITSILDGCTALNACGQPGTYFNLNGGEIKAQGVEASVTASFDFGKGGDIFLNANGAHQQAKFVDVPTNVTGGPILDSKVAQIPQWTMSAGVNVRHPLTEETDGFFDISYNGQRGGGQDTVTPATPFIPLSDIDNVNLRLGVDYKRFTFALHAKNLTNEVVPILRLQAGTIPLVNRYSRPRTVGATITYKW